MNDAASVALNLHTNVFSTLFSCGTLVGTKARYDTQDSDCKKGNHLLQRGAIYSEAWGPSTGGLFTS